MGGGGCFANWIFQRELTKSAFEEHLGRLPVRRTAELSFEVYFSDGVLIMVLVEGILVRICPVQLILFSASI